jgi:hypothetical protein
MTTMNFCDVSPSLRSKRNCGIEEPSLRSRSLRSEDSWMKIFSMSGIDIAVCDNLDLRASCKISRGLAESREDTLFGMKHPSTRQHGIGTLPVV